MLNFPTPTDTALRTPVVAIKEPAPVRETVTVRPARTADPDPVLVSTGSSTWEKVRDYVMGQVVEHHGPQPRDPRRENTIFMAFCGRWEDKAMDIARYAFEEADGMWLGAPIRLERFHRTSDTVFAQKIAEKLPR